MVMTNEASHNPLRPKTYFRPLHTTKTFKYFRPKPKPMPRPISMLMPGVIENNKNLNENDSGEREDWGEDRYSFSSGFDYEFDHFVSGTKRHEWPLRVEEKCFSSTDQSPASTILDENS